MTVRDPLPLKPVIEDSSLTPGACRIILYVWSLGEGEHEIPHARFAALLNHPGERRLAREIKLATELGPLERSPGGRGHSDCYEVRSAEIDGLSEDSPADSADLKDSPAENPDLNNDSPADSEGLRGGTIGGSSSEDVEGVEGAREVSEDAEQQIQGYGDLMEGFRDALRDYLAERVDSGRQRAYVNTLATVLEGADPQCFEKNNGRQISDAEKRKKHVAYCLNDLATTDETEMSRPVGDFGNLRTKMRVLSSQYGRDWSPSSSSSSRNGRSSPKGASGNSEQKNPHVSPCEECGLDTINRLCDKCRASEDGQPERIGVDLEEVG